MGSVKIPGMKTIFVFAILIAQFSSAETLGMRIQPQDIPKEWRTCVTDADCGIGLMGCYRWVPVNKKYLTSMGPFGGHYIKDSMVACKKSLDPGPMPKVSCKSK